jgi:hypothetical protein
LEQAQDLWGRLALEPHSGKFGLRSFGIFRPARPGGLEEENSIQINEYVFVEPCNAFWMPTGSAAESTASGIEQLESNLIAGLQTGDRSSLLNASRLVREVDHLSFGSFIV